MRPSPTSERTWFVGRGCSATQAPRHPRNIQQRREAAAARKRRPNFKSAMLVVTSKATATNETERKASDDACRATTGCRPSAMPTAKAAAIATAGSFMALFATAQAFQYEKSAETDRTNAFPRFRSRCSGPQSLLASEPTPLAPPNREPAWKDRRKDTQSP